MKFFVLIGLLCASLPLASCGGGDSTGAAGQPAPASTESSTSEEATGDESPSGATPKIPKRPRISPPSGPPPKQIVIKDLKRGTGAVLKWGTELSVRSVSFDYRTGKILEDSWRDPFEWGYGPGQVVRAWVKGLKGMRVGGVRELIAPSRLAYKEGAEIWVVELLSVSKVPG